MSDNTTTRAALAQARRLYLHYRSLADDGRPIEPATVAEDLARLVALMERAADALDQTVA